MSNSGFSRARISNFHSGRVGQQGGPRLIRKRSSRALKNEGQGPQIFQQPGALLPICYSSSDDPLKPMSGESPSANNPCLAAIHLASSFSPRATMAMPKVVPALKALELSPLSRRQSAADLSGHDHRRPSSEPWLGRGLESGNGGERKSRYTPPTGSGFGGYGVVRS